MGHTSIPSTSLQTQLLPINFINSSGTILASIDGSGNATFVGETLSAALNAIAGTAGAPGVAVGGSTDGVFRVAAGVMGLTGSGTEVARFSATLAQLPAASILTWNGRATLQSPADGQAVWQNNAGTDAAIRLMLGGTTASFPAWKRAASSTTLAARLADDSADAPVSASNATLSGNLVMSSAAPIVNATAATTYLQTYQNNGTTVTQMDKGGTLYPALVDPVSFYDWDDWHRNGSTASYSQNGNVVLAAVNSVSAPLLGASNMGAAYVNTSSITAGGYVSNPGALPLIKSATITYTWRFIFFMPAVSSGTNRYTAYIGGFVCTGTANNANTGPFAGPFLKYSDNVNSGNWVMGSAVNGTQTTGNSATAPTPGAWNIMQAVLANGVYTFSTGIPGGALTQIGTLTDANITTSPANGQDGALGGIAIFPDGANFTTNAVVMIDRSDFYVTGLSR